MKNKCEIKAFYHFKEVVVGGGDVEKVRAKSNKRLFLIGFYNAHKSYSVSSAGGKFHCASILERNVQSVFVCGAVLNNNQLIKYSNLIMTLYKSFKISLSLCVAVDVVSLNDIRLN